MGRGRWGGNIQWHQVLIEDLASEGVGVGKKYRNKKKIHVLMCVGGLGVLYGIRFVPYRMSCVTT